MRLGMFMMPVHPPQRPMADTLEEDTAKSLYADELGFEELWMGEHYSATTEPFPSPFMFMAGLVPRTRNLRFGTAVINLPNHHPVIVAAEAAQFDHMSRGRFEFGIGPGGLVSDMELFDNFDHHVRTGRMMESIDMIERIWLQDPPYEFKGEFYDIHVRKSIVPNLGIGYMPKPYQKPRPPISISVGSPNSGTARTAAEKGWGMITSNISPVYSAASHWKMYSETCAKLGREATGENWRIARNLLIAPSDAEAEARVYGDGASNHYYFGYMRAVLARAGILSILKPRPDMTDEEASERAITEECVIYGSPDTVLEKLVALRERIGPFGALLMTGIDWSGPNGAWERESMRLLATDVMPRFRRHLLAQG
jgi:alkanesulfonate monooxygenase SsuD/methylene tetrahydromethanopterin reductase-like flavin-dependent oxidoreductase (luciferase family)